MKTSTLYAAIAAVNAVFVVVEDVRGQQAIIPLIALFGCLILAKLYDQEGN